MIRTTASVLVTVVLAAVVALAPSPDPDPDLPASPAATRPAPRPVAARSGGVVVVAAGDIACRPGDPPSPAGAPFGDHGGAACH
jgi:hypothetical protein